MINSPRSLKACKELGILPIELYKISIEEYRSQNPNSITLEPKMLQFRYEGYEKFRKDSITLVKKRREILIKKENESYTSTTRLKTYNNFLMRSLEKMKEGERKAMQNLKNQQKYFLKVNKKLFKRKNQKIKILLLITHP